MEALHNLAFDFEHALTIHNLLYCALGCAVGTFVGLLPGLGPLATISLLLPLTYSMDTTGALIMLAGIYCGAQHGDSVSAITMKIPHASSIVACIDGYAMTLKGQVGLALFTAGFSSFIGGTVAIVVLTFLAPSLGEVAFLFKLRPTWTEFKRIWSSALRGSVIGSFLGILPGGGPAIAQFATYAADKKMSKYKHEIGTGCIEGVAGQAASRTSFIPLMGIGIPENPVMALMMAAFIIKGIQPGPNTIAGHPELFWGLVASMRPGPFFLIACEGAQRTSAS